MKPDGESDTVICSSPLPIETAGSKRAEIRNGADSVMGFDLDLIGFD
jgi:hypothetical protein